MSHSSFQNQQIFLQGVQSIRHLQTLLDLSKFNQNEVIGIAIHLGIRDSHVLHKINQFRNAINTNKVEDAKQLLRSIERRIIELQNQQ